ASVLVTGAGGSIGSELCRQIVECSPRQLILFDSSEYNLYAINEELREQLSPSVDIIPVIGSVSDRRAVERVFKTYKPTHVLHAAAYKHVPLMESNITEAIINNIS